MKKMTMWAVAILFAAGISVSAQNPGGPGPRFVDADKDGKCDICGRTPGQGPGRAMWQGRGPGRGMMRMGCRCGQCQCCGQQSQASQAGQQQNQQQAPKEQPKK